MEMQARQMIYLERAHLQIKSSNRGESMFKNKVHNSFRDVQYRAENRFVSEQLPAKPKLADESDMRRLGVNRDFAGGAQKLDDELADD